MLAKTRVGNPFLFWELAHWTNMVLQPALLQFSYSNKLCSFFSRALPCMQNAIRLLTVTIIGDILLVLGKISVAAACGLIAFGMSETKFFTSPEKYPDTYLSR